MAKTYNLIQQQFDRAVILRRLTEAQWQNDQDKVGLGHGQYWSVTEDEAAQYALEQQVNAITELKYSVASNSPGQGATSGKPGEGDGSGVAVVDGAGGLPEPMVIPEAQLAQGPKQTWDWSKVPKGELKTAGEIYDNRNWSQAWHFHNRFQITGERFCCQGLQLEAAKAFHQAREKGII